MGAGGEGESHRYAWGDTWLPDRANTQELGLNRTTPVGIFAGGATPEGLLDVTGNAWEWCRDWFAGDTYRRRAGEAAANGVYSQDPVGPGQGTYKVLRGGSAWDDRNLVRCAVRFGDFPVNRGYDVGFRVARSSLD